MPKFFEEVDLGSVPEIRAIPDSTIVVRIVNWEKVLSSNQNEMIRFECDILKPDDLSQDPGKFFFQIPLMEKTLFRFKQLFRAANLLEQAKAGFDPELLLQKEVGMHIRLRSYQGRPQSDPAEFLKANVAKPAMRGSWEDVEKITVEGDVGAEIGGKGEVSADVGDSPF